MDVDDYSWSFVTGAVGSCYVLTSDEQETDPVQQLHDVVEEVTGQSFHKPKRSIGFY